MGEVDWFDTAEIEDGVFDKFIAGGTDNQPIKERWGVHGGDNTGRFSFE